MKDGKFEIGDKVICVNADDREYALRTGKQYTVIGISENDNNCIYVKSKNGTTGEAFFESRFEFTEPEFKPEYFSALNAKDAEEYIGEIMEFADRLFMLNNKWTQWEYIGVNTNKNSYCAFKSGNSDGIFYQFMRTCPETFAKKKKVKKVYERWVNLYPGPGNCYYKTEEEAKKNACDDLITCLHIRQEYEIEE